MNQHGLGHWIFEFDRAKRRAGSCKQRKHTITLSSYYVPNNSEEDIKDTILHEIAHALAGPRQGHNHVWKSICITIGAKPVRCYDNTVVMPEGHWQANCPGCNQKFRLHRRPKNINGRYCRKCGLTNGKLSYSKTPVVPQTV